MKLKKFVALFMAAIMLGGCSNGCSAVSYYTPQPNFLTDSHNVEHMLNSVVDLVVEHPEASGQYRSFCSAFFINETTIATANHCVATRVEVIPGMIFQLPPVIGTEVRYQLYSQRNQRHFRPHLARVLQFDEEHDVAILEIDIREPHSTFFLVMNDFRTPKIGEETIVCGHPGELQWVVTKGIITHVSVDANGNPTSLMSNAGVYYGNSGGMLVNQNGEVIGVTSAIAYGQPYLGIFVPIRYVVNLLVVAQTSH